MLTVERTNRSRSPSLAAEHGLAYHLVSQRGDEQCQILLDYALTSRSLLTNLQIINVDPGHVDALVLSHGHGDHYGGLLALAEATPVWAERHIPLYVGGEDTFARRWTVDAHGQRLRSEQLERANLEARGLRVIVADKPAIVADHLVLSGQIRHVTDFERGLPNARLEVAPSGELVPDPFVGEIATYTPSGSVVWWSFRRVVTRGSSTPSAMRSRSPGCNASTRLSAAGILPMPPMTY